MRLRKLDIFKVQTLALKELKGILIYLDLLSARPFILFINLFNKSFCQFYSVLLLFLWIVFEFLQQVTGTNSFPVFI